MTGIVAFGNKDVKDKFSDKMLTDDRHGIMGFQNVWYSKPNKYKQVPYVPYRISTLHHRRM